MGGGVSYDCDCGYSKQFESGYGMNDFYAMNVINSHAIAYCEDCGFVQPKIRDELLEKIIPLMDGIAEILENNNYCKKCNSNLKILENQKVDVEVGADDYFNDLKDYFDYYEFRYSSNEILTCPHCKDLKEVPTYKEYFVDTSTQKVIKRNAVRDTKCADCQVEMTNICRKETDETVVRCPKCGQFNMRQYEMLWD